MTPAAMAEIFFEAEGLLDDLVGPARAARLALLRELSSAGVPLDELRRAATEDRLILLPVERVFDPGSGSYTAEEIAARAAVSPEFLRRLVQALGAPNPPEGERAFGDRDLVAAGWAKNFLEAGLPEEALLESLRLIGIAMANLASANLELVGEVLIEPGLDERELALRYATAARTMAPLLGETLLHAYRIHLREAIRQAVITESELASGKLSGADQVAIAFADLVEFTRLGESLEVEEIGSLTGRLFELASEAATPPVRLVKMIGDGAMFASKDPGALVRAGLDLVNAAGARDLPSLRVGIAMGEALNRSGDWYGRPVNLAARLTAFARPDSVVVADSIKTAIEHTEDFSFSFAGRRRFKGLKGDVAVHRVRASKRG
jgi:adenylate cyclase